MSEKYTFHVEYSGDIAAGLRPFTDEISITVLSSDPGGEPGEFEVHMEEALKEWYDEACVSFVPGE